MPNYEVLIFDFDGTLIDSASASRRIYLEASRKVGVEATEEDFTRAIWNPAKDFTLNLGIPEDKIKQFFEKAHNLELKCHFNMFPGISEMISNLNRDIY
jgi:beta-phosphoglucomutase-like phosphatase (HAD superfamily)